MTSIAIPEVKSALRGLTQQACRDAVELAIGTAANATESRRILEERLGTRQLTRRPPMS